ncbi:SNF2 family N-terminal domain-containing protein [Cerioporus squamosus]|nr:SNF2 family N-terminal domain-containing protein [Cerioporus squamosus]
MPEPSSDPPDARTLFSPVRDAYREASSDAPGPADTPVSTSDEIRTGHMPPRQKVAFVELPTLSRIQRTKYRSVAEDALNSDEEFAHAGVERILGEVEHGSRVSYYVRYNDGIVHKIPGRHFARHFPHLVDEYEIALHEGTLPPFDPTSSDVHPGSRQAALTFKIPGSSSRKGRSSHAQDDYSSDELARDAESDFSYFSDDPAARRSTRTAALTASMKMSSALPFSPKKTRSGRRPILVHGSDSDSDIQEISPPVRKSVRARTLRRTNLDDADYEDSVSVDDADIRNKSAKKKVVRGKASRPAYGRFRFVADLQLDEEEYEDIAPLIAHRSICEKCHAAPTHEQQVKKRGRKRKSKDDESEDEETRLAKLGGWVRCLKCPVAAHWGCLAKTQRDEILRAANERDRAEWKEANSGAPEPTKRVTLEPHQTTEFICGSCMKGGVCMGCKEVALKPDQPTPGNDVVQQTVDATPAPAPPADDKADSPHELLYRCFTCKRLAHYAHLPVPTGYDGAISSTELATYYQYDTGWRCADCFSYVYLVEHILAWRPYPADAVEPPHAPDEPPNHKAMLPREYLVKWVDRSYRRTSWVPHGWLLATAPNKLKNFLQAGTKVPLLVEPVSEQRAANVEDDVPGFEIGRDETDVVQGVKANEETGLLIADSEAERRIPLAWRTVDRVLDVRLWRPRRSSKGKGKGKKLRVGSSDEEDGLNEVDPDIAFARDDAYNRGEEPPSGLMLTIEEYESQVGRKLSEKDAGKVAWAFFKWDDLGYDNASWDSPPRSSEVGYDAYERAFERFIYGRSVTVPTRSKKDSVSKNGSRWTPKEHFTVDNQPKLGQSAQLKLMPFQVEGVNWLVHNWHKDQHCILADEMGLGKTVQIVTFIGFIASTFKSFPALVVVPNSTITNWVREFERWAPKLRVVPLYGEAKAREVIKNYELFHSRPALGTTGAKYHVLVTTYETVTNPKEFGPIFKSTPRWEMLVVDEGQRLKSDESLIFKRLKELNSFHRIIMTGTPLNNNIRELFNLMNFLDPDQWKDLEALSKHYEELTDELVKELHGRLKPYFLRRIKSEVLQLPPKNEVIVPVSMAPLQKEIYRSILSQNLDILRSLAEDNASSKGSNTVTKTNMNNMLMQLRKCLQHPYLVSNDIEPKDLLPQETHDRLVAASAKLRLLKMLLPKLRARGHRVLLFSQFVIALNIIEDFLIGEGIKYLRLDGNTKQADRQKDMDEFNKPDSDIFIYLLTTRAGGVGINLWSADTVIIFDPDYNPHQDLQAIARSHRYGQKKTVLVFKLMVKDSAEERIMQAGKKKLVLDHLIVQKMDDESGSKEDVKSILMFGAKALFEENEETVAREVHYSEHDVDNLIEKTEREGDQVEPDSGGAGSLFAFAKVWSADKDDLEELAEQAPEHAEEADSWAKALELIAARKAAEQEKEVTGRGARRKAAAVFAFPQQSLDLGDTPTKDKEKQKSKGKKKSKGKSAASDDSDFHAPVSDAASESDDTDGDRMDVDDIQMLPVPGSDSPFSQVPRLAQKQKKHRSDVPYRPLSPIQNRQGPGPGEEFCGLCATYHAPGHCSMTESPENLAEYRLMLMQHAGDESIEERRAAIRVIDETLHRLGKINLIYGQPLHLVEMPSQKTTAPPAKKHKHDGGNARLPGQVASGSAMPRHAVQPIAGPSRMNDSIPSAGLSAASATAATMPEAVQRISKTANAISSSPKRPRPTGGSTDTTQHKKAKESGGTNPCVVCGRAPHHLVKDCPVVAQGPQSITEAIERLSETPDHVPVVNALKSILSKVQRRMLISSSANASTSGSIIDLSESRRP